MDFEVRKDQANKFMKERIIANDERDQRLWELITDVPKLNKPWNYICFITNVIIPGMIF